MSYNKVNKYIATLVLYCLFLTPQLSAKVGDIYQAEFRQWNRVSYLFEIISQERKECKIIKPIYPTEMPETVFF